MAQEIADPSQEALVFLNPEKGIGSVEAALAGARDIIAERVNEDAAARQSMRRLFYREGIVQSSLVKGKESEATKHRDYLTGRSRLRGCPATGCWRCCAAKMRAF